MKRISNISSRLKEYRDMYNLTLADMERKTGIPAQTINRYELGQRVPKIDIAVSIAEALKINPLWIQGYDVGMTDKSDSLNEKNIKTPSTTVISDTGQRIKEKRLLAGISIEELAEQSNVSADIITRLETGVPTSFDSKILKSIARVLKTNMDYLAGWSDDGSKLDPPNPFDAIFDMPQQPVAYIHGSDGASKTITDKDMIDLIDKFFDLMEKEKKDKK